MASSELLGAGVLEAVATRVTADGAADAIRAVDVAERAQDDRRALVHQPGVVASGDEVGSGLRHRRVALGVVAADAVERVEAQPEAEGAGRGREGVARLHGLGLGVGVDALVEEGGRVLVGGDQAVEPLVAQLVDGDDVERVDPGPGQPPVAPGGDEGGVLHASTLLGAGGRVDDGEGAVGVAAVRLAEVVEPEEHAVPLQLRRASRSRAGRARGWPRFRRWSAVELAELAPRGEGEVVDARGCTKRRATRPALAHLGALLAGGADDHVRGGVDGDVVVAEVGVELGEVVEREVSPAPVLLEPRQLGEPLPDHVEAARVAGAEEQRGQARASNSTSNRTSAPGATGAGRGTRMSVSSSGSPGEVLSAPGQRSWPSGRAKRVTVMLPHSLGAARAAERPRSGEAHEERAIVLERVQVEVDPDLSLRPGSKRCARAWCPCR